jgi:hypothetical protein
MTETMIREDFVRIVLVGLLDPSGNGQQTFTLVQPPCPLS